MAAMTAGLGCGGLLCGCAFCLAGAAASSLVTYSLVSAEEITFFEADVRK